MTARSSKGSSWASAVIRVIRKLAIPFLDHVPNTLPERAGGSIQKGKGALGIPSARAVGPFSCVEQLAGCPLHGSSLYDFALDPRVTT